MKNKIKRILGMLLVIALCLPFIPATAFAAPVATDTGASEQAEEIAKEEIPNDLPLETTDEIISEPDATGPEEIGYDAPVASPTTPPAALSPVEPELLKVVSEPLPTSPPTGTAGLGASGVVGVVPVVPVMGVGSQRGVQLPPPLPPTMPPPPPLCTVSVKVSVASGRVPLLALSATGYVPAASPAAMSSFLSASFHVIFASPLVFETVTVLGYAGG